MQDMEALMAVVDSSATLSGWCLAVIGGSVLAIISTSYQRPHNLSWRLPYLLYIPGWALLGGAVYTGNQIARRYVAAQISPEIAVEILRDMNSDFQLQRFLFTLGLSCFALWLLLYLAWWIFGPWPNSTIEGTGG